MFEKVYKNKYGYYELKNKPSEIEMKEYYSNIYYQEAKGSYEKTYTGEELIYFQNKLEQKYRLLQDIINIDLNEKNRFLDIGCGEGWSLKFFEDKKWEVNGLDYSSYGCGRYNAKNLNNLIEGDVYKSIETLVKGKQEFKCIYMLNVLEHVLEPLLLLEKCYHLLSNDGVLLIQVPNDFSRVQQHVFESRKIDTPYWVCGPDHISYFNRQGLNNICKEAGFRTEKVISDFPIDLCLFNEDTNYVMDKTKGKKCHMSRVDIDNFIHSSSVDNTNKLYEVLAELELGRNIIAFLTK